MAETERGLIIIIRCQHSDCSKRGQPQSITINRTYLRQMLEPGADDRVTGPTCGHTWSLSAEEKENIRKKFEDSSM